MASAPQPNLPLFYNDLMPLNSRDHAKFKSRTVDNAKWLATQHAIPLTADEFVQSQRNYPIIFSAGETILPLALMGLNEGVNTFVDADGKITDPIYLPAYVRRYPFMLARLQPDSDELSLCFDPTSESLGEFAEGDPLFDGEGKISQFTQGALDFCENFEQAGRRTQAFVDELVKNDLLMDGEVAIQREGTDQPFLYRGFKMVNQEKLQALPAEVVDAWNKNGILMLIHAHLFSLEQMRVIFGRQVQQGKGPQPIEAPAGNA